MRRCDRLRRLIDALREKPKGDAKRLEDYRLMVDMLAERLFGERLFGEAVEAYIARITKPDVGKLLGKLAESPEGIALVADMTECRQAFLAEALSKGMLAIRRKGDHREIDIQPSAERHIADPSYTAKRHVFRVHLARQANRRVAEGVTYIHNGEKLTLDRQEALRRLAELLGQSPDDIRLEGRTIYTRSGLRPKGERQGRIVVTLSFRHNRRQPISYPISVFLA